MHSVLGPRQCVRACECNLQRCYLVTSQRALFTAYMRRDCEPRGTRPPADVLASSRRAGACGVALSCDARVAPLLVLPPPSFFPVNLTCGPPPCCTEDREILDRASESPPAPSEVPTQYSIPKSQPPVLTLQPSHETLAQARHFPSTRYPDADAEAHCGPCVTACVPRGLGVYVSGTRGRAPRSRCPLAASRSRSPKPQLPDTHTPYSPSCAAHRSAGWYGMASSCSG